MAAARIVTSALLWLSHVAAHATDRRLSDRITCPAPDAPLARVTAPALTTTCPSTCSINDLCVYYPAGTESKCVATEQRACLGGDTCTFQCLPNAIPSGAWFLTIYDTDTALNDVNYWNSQWAPRRLLLQSIAVNASEIRAWAGDVVLPPKSTILYLSGNDAANNVPLTSTTMLQGRQSLPRGTVVRFSLPSSFIDGLQHHTQMRIENLKFPDMKTDASELSFPTLDQLYLRNSLLTSFPLANASLPVLTALDLSVNSIADFPATPFPNSLTYLNLSLNALTRIPNDSLPMGLTTLDMSHNAIEEIPAGSLPSKLQTLALDDNLLNAIPRDVAKMSSLSTLSLDGNDLQDIPASAFPPRGVQSLHIANCSLSAVPKALSNMTALTELSLAHNTLSADFSALPRTLQVLDVENCGLQTLPSELSRLSKLTSLSLSKNPRALSMVLGGLPSSLRKLYLRDNALDKVPAVVKELQLELLTLDSNPLGQLAPRSLPSSLQVLSLSNTTFSDMPPSTLPTTLTELYISESLLAAAPPDLPNMRNLSMLVITQSQLSALDVGAAAQTLQQLDLKQNRLTHFTGSFPSLLSLDLRHNALETFSVRDAFPITTLQLADNKLTTFPDSIFQMSRLQLLNLAQNPIQDFSPTSDQIDALLRIPVVILSQAMFSSRCGPSDRVDIHGYKVCPPVKKAGKSWIWLIPVNLGIAAILALFVGFFWYRRKLQNKRLKDVDSIQASLDKQRRHQAAAAAWTDTVLVQHRLDEDLVERTQLLSASGRDEVWRVSYKNDEYALKQPTQDAVNRQALDAFVYEIKLLSSLSHPSVVQLVGVTWTKESDLTMVTEFMDSGDLRSYLDHNPKIYGGWTATMVRIALQITEAIVYLHSLDPVIIHRDLTSRHVLLDKAMHAKLCGFGRARPKCNDESMTGSTQSTAPEVLVGDAYDESIDIYALGVIMSEIDTHKLPLEQATAAEGVGAVHVSASCPLEIRSLVERCTAKDPIDRPNGLHIAYELRQILKHAPRDGFFGNAE